MIKSIGWLLGGLSILYFVLYAAAAGLNNKFTFFWLALGVIVIGATSAGARLVHWQQRLPRLVWCTAASVGMVGAGLFALALAMVIFYGAGRPQNGADYLIVLGSQVRGRRPSDNLQKRLDAALRYLRENPNTKAVLSGGQGDDEEISEAQAMADFLTAEGIDAGRLILEDRSRNTEENLRFSRAQIEADLKKTAGGGGDAAADESGNAVHRSADEKGAAAPDFGRVVIVTSNFHVFRSLGIARRQGFVHAEGLGAGTLWYTIPNLYVREAFAVLKYAFCGQM